MLEKLQRNERIAVMMKVLTDTPGVIHNLSEFNEMFGTAKSSVSEDLDIVQRLLERYGQGAIQTIAGAAGGIRFVPSMGKEQATMLVKGLCETLSSPERILPGDYLYMLDVIFNPQTISDIGRIFCGHFFNKGIDYVVTVETKGIPLAFITAKYLNVPLVIVRHYNEATDGSSVNINYVSGSSKRIQTMVLSLKALKRNSKILFIDDFMKGGGTAKGIIELAKEFDCEVAGIGVLVETVEPQKKLVENYVSLLTLKGVNEEKGVVEIRPSEDWQLI